MIDFCKNVPNWTPTASDYRLVFRPVGGVYCEVSGNLSRFKGVTLSEYLSSNNIIVDDRCTFMRLQYDSVTLEFRVIGECVVIDYKECRL